VLYVLLRHTTQREKRSRLFPLSSLSLLIPVIVPSLVRILMKGPQVIMEPVMFGPRMRVFMKFFVQLPQVMMESLMRRASAHRHPQHRKRQHCHGGQKSSHSNFLSHL
jgi:hypothetical protein